MKRNKSKFGKFKYFVLALSFMTIGLSTNLYATICQYIVGGSWQGEFSHCYTVTVGEGVSYSRSYCVYHASSRYGIEFSGSMEIPYEQANQC